MDYLNDDIEHLLENGFIILDKWQGPTSRDITATVKKVLDARIAGHSGTLDPQVSGVLLITLNNACKIMPALQRLDKEYVGIMQMHKDVDDASLEKAVKSFIGTIKQRPPVRSAVARRDRFRTVHSFEILERGTDLRTENVGREVLFKISCEAGTYVRVVCHDIGKLLGGAHMSELRRTRVGNYSEQKCVKIHDLADAYADWKSSGSEDIRKYILPVEAAVAHIKKIIVNDNALKSVTNGSPLYSKGVKKADDQIIAGELLAMMSSSGQLVALGVAKTNSNDFSKEKGVVVATDRVIVKPIKN